MNDRICQQVRQLVDREEILARKYHYCRCADLFDAAGMASIFTEDATITFRPDGGASCQGRAAIEAWYRNAMGDVVASSHHLSNVEVVFTGPNEARLHCYLYSWQRFAGHPEIADRHRWARYEDTFVRTGDGWLQSDLVYLVAGEIGPDAVPRIGEVIAHGPWKVAR